MSYAKLFSTITESSLWSTSKETRLLFVSMLARANAVGFVEASIPGLARISNLSRKETEKALKELMAPDPDDKSGNNEGRRLVKMDGGWGIVNYEIYRNRRDEEERRAYMREYMARYRKQSVNNVKPSKPQLAQAEGEAAPEAKAESRAESDYCTPSPEDMEKAKSLTISSSKPVLPPKSFRDFRAVHGRLHVGKDEREDWEALLRAYEWEAMHDMHESLKDDRIFLNNATQWLAKNYKITG